MSRILHTADLHLTETASERWDALTELVGIARQREVSALVIAGDLFDQNIEAENLRKQLRNALSDTGFHTIILPGNHDHKAYRSGLYYGDTVTVITNWEEPVRMDGFTFWGLPYTRISGDRLVGRLLDLGKKMNPDENNILIYHGELLDAYFSRLDLGNEGDLRYMPASLTYFETLPLRYILAGHFHSRYTSWQVPGGGLFIYPGSPVAITRRETGQRTANLITLEQEPEEIMLNTYHYEELEIVMDPFNRENPLDLLAAKIADIHPKAKVILNIEGLFNGAVLGMNEEELASAIRVQAGEKLAGEPSEGFYDVRHVLEDDLFKQFKSKLTSLDCSPELKEQAAKMAIRAFRVVKSCS